MTILYPQQFFAEIGGYAENERQNASSSRIKRPFEKRCAFKTGGADSAEEEMDRLAVNNAVLVGYLLVPRLRHVGIEHDEPTFVDVEVVGVAANLQKRLLGTLVPEIAELDLDGVLPATKKNTEIECALAERHLADYLAASIEHALEKRLEDDVRIRLVVFERRAWADS